MSVDPVIRELGEALNRSQVASSPGIAALLDRAIVRSLELEKAPGDEAIIYFRSLGRDLLRLRGSANSKGRLKCLFHVCAFLWQYGECLEAISYARHGIRLAEATSNLPEIRRHYLVMGALCADSGDRGQALQAYLTSLQTAIRLKDGFGQCAIWNNLAALYIDCGLYSEAIACATNCLRLAGLHGVTDAEVLCRAQNNVMLARHRLGDNAGAYAAAQDLLAQTGEPRSALDAARQVVLERNLVLVLLAAGDIVSAKAHVRRAQSLVSRYPSPRQELLVGTVRGLYEVVAGDAKRGITTLQETVSFACRQVPAAIADTLSALAKSYEEIGDCEKALEATRCLISHLESLHVDSSIARISTIDYGVSGSAPSSNWSNMADLRRSEADLRSRVLQRELFRTRQEMLERMAVAADIREDISGEHGYRVGRLSSLLAREIGWDRDACNAIDVAARLHDIGKIGIPERILFDRKMLKEAEKHFIASHTLVGAEILSKSEIPQVRIAEDIARCHHEWWDGSGYPKGLAGAAIPRAARIVALADVFDAMTHGRPYAEAISVEAALDQIAALRGRQFDPELTDHFLALIRRLAVENADLDAFLGKAARNSPFLKARARIKEMLAQGVERTALSGPLPAPGTPLN